jgi:hypothetical protein
MPLRAPEKKTKVYVQCVRGLAEVFAMCIRARTSRAHKQSAQLSHRTIDQSGQPIVVVFLAISRCALGPSTRSPIGLAKVFAHVKKGDTDLDNYTQSAQHPHRIIDQAGRPHLDNYMSEKQEQADHQPLNQDPPPPKSTTAGATVVLSLYGDASIGSGGSVKEHNPPS